MLYRHIINIYIFTYIAIYTTFCITVYFLFFRHIYTLYMYIMYMYVYIYIYIYVYIVQRFENIKKKHEKCIHFILYKMTK